MADCVRYLTNNDTVTTANSSGCNGFSFAFTYASGGAGNFPVVVSIQQCKKWFSRVKNWTLSTDAAIVDAFGNASSMGGGTMTPNAGNATTELQLIGTGRIRDFQYTNGVNGFADVSFMSTGIVKDSGDLYPGFEGISSLSGTGPGAGSLDIYMYDNGTGLPSISGDVDGVTVPIFYDTTSFPGLTSFTFSTWTLTPQEYWPYAQHSDGAAIYDTSTGDIIGGRSPLK